MPLVHVRHRAGRCASILPPRAAWRADLHGLPIDEARGVVLADGGERRLTPQEQAVLAALLVFETATHDRLITALWGAWLEPPESALGVIRVIVLTLRRALRGTPAEILTIRHQGYRLALAANDQEPAMTSPAIPVSRSNRLPQLCADYLKAQARRLAAEGEEKAARVAIFAELGARELLRAGPYLIQRVAVKAIAAKPITKEMVGGTIPGRRGYDLLKVTPLEAANDNRAGA